jgi:hypothetical protein
VWSVVSVVVWVGGISVGGFDSLEEWQEFFVAPSGVEFVPAVVVGSVTSDPHGRVDSRGTSQGSSGGNVALLEILEDDWFS